MPGGMGFSRTPARPQQNMATRVAGTSGRTSAGGRGVVAGQSMRAFTGQGPTMSGIFGSAQTPRRRSAPAAPAPRPMAAPAPAMAAPSVTNNYYGGEGGGGGFAMPPMPSFGGGGGASMPPIIMQSGGGGGPMGPMPSLSAVASGEGLREGLMREGWDDEAGVQLAVPGGQRSPAAATRALAQLAGARGGRVY
jgi:hypothetical protein